MILKQGCFNGFFKVILSETLILILKTFFKLFFYLCLFNNHHLKIKYLISMY